MKLIERACVHCCATGGIYHIDDQTFCLYCGKTQPRTTPPPARHRYRAIFVREAKALRPSASETLCLPCSKPAPTSLSAPAEPPPRPTNDRGTSPVPGQSKADGHTHRCTRPAPPGPGPSPRPGCPPPAKGTAPVLKTPSGFPAATGLKLLRPRFRASTWLLRRRIPSDSPDSPDSRPCSTFSAPRPPGSLPSWPAPSSPGSSASLAASVVEHRTTPPPARDCVASALSVPGDESKFSELIISKLESSTLPLRPMQPSESSSPTTRQPSPSPFQGSRPYRERYESRKRPRALWSSMTTASSPSTTSSSGARSFAIATAAALDGPRNPTAHHHRGPRWPIPAADTAAASAFSVTFYLRQPLSLGNVLGEALRLTQGPGIPIPSILCPLQKRTSMASP